MLNSDHPWTHVYAPGATWSAPLHAMPVPQLLTNTAARWPDQAALRFEGRTFSYAELDALTDRMAQGLRRIGVHHGTHVGLYLPNTPHYFIAFFAILKAGAVVVNYSPLDAAAVLAHKIDDSRTDVIVTLDTPELFLKINGYLDSTRLKTLIIGSAGEFEVGAKLADRGISWDHRRVRFSDVSAQRDTPFLPAATDLSAIAVLQYTGGTTGHPKGAMLTHSNLSMAVSQIEEMLIGPGTLRRGAERFLVVLPMFHVYSMVLNMIFGFAIGAELVVHQRFDLAAALREIEESKITVFLGVPTMYVGFIGHPDIERTDLSSLKWCNSGGAPIAGEVFSNFVRMARCRLLEGWGMTEICGVGTLTTGAGSPAPGTCGAPVPGAEVKVIDLATLTDLPLGECGEICIRGPQVMKGYWNNPVATAEVMTADGFMRTGDVGYMSDDGFVYLVDRTKDMIICSGFNVYPRNIEEAIYRHPSVEEVSVIGVPDAYRGESPKAFIKFRPGTEPLTLDALRDFLKDYLGKHELPLAMEARAELPKTAVGKLSKIELYAEAAAEVAGKSPK
ncbi:long-chain fatty acid--CoA ligase [Variovorax sp. LG9.2]|uniref:long-chain-fatty-acid--CoA ligase n=1 Tax=Variovorax sp. LG9.2 TaxID=3048626 RepID=UPI002B22733F|nr:long-chain fatty acid--CoA ligase [Variovorax sp. LG9.2]MEB0059845.1 long-chain fatty acid--CoA ligase [Variovorax sp. LG9.2]